MSKIKLHPHQEKALLSAKEIRCMGLWWEMGTGKTGGTISILRQLYNSTGKLKKTLIIAPSAVIFNWKEEFSKFSNVNSGLIHVVHGSSTKRKKILIEATEKESAIIITNWEALRTDYVFELVKAWGPEVIVGDEVHKVKSPKTQTHKKCVELTDICRTKGGNVYALTGTPILNNITDIFGIYRFLDGGYTFGDNFWVFQNRYMYDANQAWAHQQNHFPKLEPRPELYEELQSKMYKIASRVTKKEALPYLPPFIEKTMHVNMVPRQAKMYTEMQKDFITFVEGKEKEGVAPAVVANLALTKALRLLQICTGFVVDEDGQEHDVPGKNPKIELLKEVLPELIKTDKVIIWTTFKRNQADIGKACDKMKVPYVLLNGSQNAEEKQKSITEFQTNDRIRVIVANRRAGGTGTTLTAAAYSIVFSRDFSYGDEKQADARNHRKGSEIHSKIVKINFITKNTIEEHVLEAIANKHKISNKIVDIVRGT